MNKTFISLCSGGGGMDLGLERAGFKCKGQVEKMEYALKVLKKHWKKVPKHTDILTLLRSDSLVKIFQEQTQKEKVLQAKKVLSSMSAFVLRDSLIRLGYSLKMFPDFFQLTTDETLELSCKRFPKAGMGIRGAFWTVNTSESPSDEKDCSLLDVLEENVHPKYYLSHKAISGMIRRSERYGRGCYVFLLEQENGKTRRLKRLSLTSFKQMITEKHMYGKTLILRKLTPTEKERLQGFPKDWTLIEE